MSNTPKRLWLDFESYNTIDLKEVGTYKYAETAEIMLAAYALNDGPVRVWDLTTGAPDPIFWQALQEADEVWAHNAQFDKALVSASLILPHPPLERWRCSMAQALSHALPAALSDLCMVLKVPEDKAKLSEGKKLVQLFCKPQPNGRKVHRATRETHPAEWQRFVAYAANDIEAMRECVRRMPTWNWNASAIAEWHLDQRINERGFQVDRDLTRAGADAAVAEKTRIASRVDVLTGGACRPSQRDKFMEFLNTRFGLSLSDTRSETFRHMIRAGGLDPACVELMELSIASNKTSTAKYAALDPAVQNDGRFRGGLQFAGASRTRRWAGRLFQPQNLPSRGLPDAADVERYIHMLKHGAHHLFFDNLMLYGAAALRGVVIAKPGHKLVVADLSNIEGRVLAWLAGEKWKLQAFREYDAGTGPDLYNITAASILGGDPWKVSKKDRNVFGKVPDLASGYQGGVAGYQTFARAYGVRMADHWQTIQQQIDSRLIHKAHANLDKFGRPQLASLEISETEWLASESCKLAWRERHPATVKLWYTLQDAAKAAITYPGMVYNVGDFLRVGVVEYAGHNWLVVALPSGRYLTYFDPRLIDGAITYMGESAEEGKTTRQWIRVWTHGGKMTGNCCQTVARDILTPSLRVAEERGYLPVLTVHDEAITEVLDTPEFSSEGLVSILSHNPEWTTGLPLAAAGFEAPRYKKD